MRVGLAAAPFPSSLADGTARVNAFIRQAAEERCDIVCFPEAYLPGMRDVGFPVAPCDQDQRVQALEEVRRTAAQHAVAVILPLEWETEQGLHLVAFVISEQSEILGYQTKNQISPEEEPLYVPGSVRQVFTVKGVTFGIVICHEGWRYPETVRWAAVRGAQVVFHPHFGGAASGEMHRREWGAAAGPIYEKTMCCRAAENTIYFASVNYAARAGVGHQPDLARRRLPGLRTLRRGGPPGTRPGSLRGDPVAGPAVRPGPRCKRIDRRAEEFGLLGSFHPVALRRQRRGRLSGLGVSPVRGHLVVIPGNPTRNLLTFTNGKKSHQMVRDAGDDFDQNRADRRVRWLPDSPGICFPAARPGWGRADLRQWTKKQEEPIEPGDEFFRICKWRRLVGRKGVNA